MPHIADDCLSALVDRDVLHPDGLITSASVSLQCLDLRCECPGQLIESAFCTILLWDGLTVPEPPRERHRRHLNSSHLGRQQGLTWSLGCTPLTTENMKQSARRSTFPPFDPASAS